MSVTSELSLHDYASDYELDFPLSPSGPSSPAKVRSSPVWPSSFDNGPLETQQPPAVGQQIGVTTNHAREINYSQVILKPNKKTNASHLQVSVVVGPMLSAEQMADNGILASVDVVDAKKSKNLIYTDITKIPGFICTGQDGLNMAIRDEAIKVFDMFFDLDRADNTGYCLHRIKSIAKARGIKLSSRKYEEVKNGQVVPKERFVLKELLFIVANCADITAASRSINTRYLKADAATKIPSGVVMSYRFAGVYDNKPQYTIQFEDFINYCLRLIDTDMARAMVTKHCANGSLLGTGNIAAVQRAAGIANDLYQRVLHDPELAASILSVDPGAGTAATASGGGGMTAEIMERHSDALVLQSNALVANTAAIKDAAQVKAAAAIEAARISADALNVNSAAIRESAQIQANGVQVAAQTAALSTVDAARVAAETEARTALTLHDREEELRSRKTDAECRAIEKLSEAECRVIERDHVEGLALRNREVAASEQIAASNFRLADRNAEAAEKNRQAADLKRQAAQITSDRVMSGRNKSRRVTTNDQQERPTQQEVWPMTCSVQGCNKFLKNGYSRGAHLGRRGKCPSWTIQDQQLAARFIGQMEVFEGPAHQNEQPSEDEGAGV